MLDRSIRGGELGGLLQIRDQVLHGPDGFLTRLETLANEIRMQFNKVSGLSINQTMYSKQAGVFDLGVPDNLGLLEVKLADLNVHAREFGFKGPMLAEVGQVVEGDIVIASGRDTENLTLTTIHINPQDVVRDGEVIPGMSIRQVRRALDESGAVRAMINREDKFQLSAIDEGGVYGVVSDSSNFLNAMGVGSLFGGSGAQDMAVNAELMEDSSQLGVGRMIVDDPLYATSVSFDDGNNEGALAISAMRTTNYEVSGRRATFVAHYASTVGLLGSMVNQNKESFKAQEAAQTFVETMRESISGVSMEEELTDLIRFQRAFQASSKMISVADDLMQTVISMV